MQIVSWIAKQTGKISDRFNDYKFYVKQQPQIIDSSSTVSIQTFQSRDMTANIPCTFKWFTVRNGLTTEIPQFKGNTYICQPIDVGCSLQVEITSSDPECPGTAVLTYGPVKFDVLLKKQIEMALATGETTYIVDIGEPNYARQCQLKLEQDKITLHHIPTQLIFVFEYNMVEPKVQVVNKVPTKVKISFNPKYYDTLQQFMSRLFNRPFHIEEIAKNPFLQINMNNRKARDSLMFIIKAFNTIKHLKTTTYVSNLQKQLDFTKISEKQQQKMVDYLEHISRLNYDISKLIDLNGKNLLDKRFYLEETKRLEKEMEEIVSTYVKIIEEKFQDKEDFEKSFVVLKEKEEEIKMQKIEKYSRGLNDMERLEYKVGVLEQENFELKKSLQELQATNLNLMNSINNSPFKRKNIFESNSPSSNKFIQTPGFESPNKGFDESELRRELNELSMKHENALREIEQLKSERVHMISNVDKKQQEEVHFDGFDTKSVRSLNNHNQLNRSPSNVSSSLLLSNPNHTINPERLVFGSDTSPLKPLSPSLSLESYPIVSQLQQENITLKHEISILQKNIQSLTLQHANKEQKYKKRIAQLSEELEMYKRNNDVLNRSQHLSMEMEDYNEVQCKMLKEENEFLKKEIQSCQALCFKYKTELKKYKLDRTISEKSFTEHQVKV